jgi:nicotinamidase-related amidase
MLRGFDKGRKVALLISECQRGVVDPALTPFPGLAEQAAERGIIPKIAALAEAFRAHGSPVFHVHVALSPDFADLVTNNVIFANSKKANHMTIGSVEAESVPGLPVEPGDILHSRRFSLVAFHGTDLDTCLRNRGIDTVVICGVSTNVAVSGMALAATDLGYQVIVPEDCIAGASADSHAFLVRNTLPLYASLTDGETVKAALKDL